MGNRSYKISTIFSLSLPPLGRSLTRRQKSKPADSDDKQPGLPWQDLPLDTQGPSTKRNRVLAIKHLQSVSFQLALDCTRKKLGKRKLKRYRKLRKHKLKRDLL
jgi:hypothetical protein